MGFCWEVISFSSFSFLKIFFYCVRNFYMDNLFYIWYVNIYIKGNCCKYNFNFRVILNKFINNSLFFMFEVLSMELREKFVSCKIFSF